MMAETRGQDRLRILQQQWIEHEHQAILSLPGVEDGLIKYLPLLGNRAALGQQAQRALGNELRQARTLRFMIERLLCLRSSKRVSH